ncbi:MAG TPA: alpha-amylase family glycosyl hydrolase [Parvularculaceae bacterium]|nr:alpha-amylase family glycosyl hydrolase [Parvularculaceae bacterium]
MGEWWRGGVIYQIYPRSFFDSNDDGVGDLKGAASKIDYVKRLGVDGVWMSPFFTSPMKDFGYDVSDYCDVDPLFGSLADFDALLGAMHAAGLKLVIDQVYSHTSDQHPWFKESRRSRDNPKANWYVWARARADGGPPNNWISIFGGQAWDWDTRRRQYYLHNFLAEQPDLNFHEPQVREAVLDVARFWLDRGVDGFRLDVANFYYCDQWLRDNPPKSPDGGYARPYQHQQHIHDRSQPETLRFMEALRALTDLYDDRMTVAEIVSDSYLNGVSNTPHPDGFTPPIISRFWKTARSVHRLFAQRLKAGPILPRGRAGHSPTTMSCARARAGADRKRATILRGFFLAF